MTTRLSTLEQLAVINTQLKNVEAQLSTLGRELRTWQADIEARMRLLEAGHVRAEQWRTNHDERHAEVRVKSRVESAIAAIVAAAVGVLVGPPGGVK